ncbi:DUF943 family protein [Rouxiella sp. Mn2063]|uniref:DUF943 family protein n=1 Tax=Rouxiella sp. Mn2063 TaxID=3395262 RepID=UPI003BE768C8
MRKWLFILAVVGIFAAGTYSYLNNREVRVIAVHHDNYTVEVLVDHLPISASASIKWWVENQNSIFSKSNIISKNNGGPDYITIFAFGDGYKKEGKEDRLCFDDIKAPVNCIDKDILMTISSNRNGESRFSFERSTYIITNDGKLIETDQ